MGREVGGSNAARAPARAAPFGSVPIRQNRRYGAVTSASSLLSRDLSSDHLAASEHGYCSLARKAEEPLSGGGGVWCGLTPPVRRVVGGAVVVIFFAAAVWTLYSGLTPSESGVREAVAGYPKMVSEKQRSGSPPRTGLRDLKIRASNEYGEFDKTALRLYDLEMVMEPYRETTLRVEQQPGSESLGLSNNFLWRLRQADDSGVTSDSVDDVWNFTGGSIVGAVTVDRPGTLYVLTVQNVGGDGAVLAEGRVKVSCKYVRREIRALTDNDREAFLDAMEVFYTIPTSKGKALYGPKFDNYERVVAHHNSRIEDFCYRGGMMFLTSHAALDLLVERYLQMINPKVALALWDFMIESATMGDEWYNSIIFDEDWFGSALGSPENDFMLEGRFSNVSTIYDPSNQIVKGGVKANHNPYGYVTSPRNYQDLPRVTRTSSFCGLTSHATFSTAETFIGCFEENGNLYDWETCMEDKVHGDLHGLLGGGFKCNTDMQRFADDHPEYSVRLLSFALEYLLFNYWPMNGFVQSANTCDARCTRGQAEPCGCTCNIDAFAISDQETYDYCESFMANAATKFSGDEFITYDADAAYPYGFLKDGGRMSDEETLLLMRYMVKIGCEPGSVGAMITSASPLDPIFWTLHPVFEKALHILWLTPKYAERYDMQWVDTGICKGSGYSDQLPFTENILGLGTGKTFLTSERLFELMRPSNVGMPYIYEGFNNWGNSDAAFVKEYT